MKVSHDTVWRFLRAKGLSFKKSLFAAEQTRPDVLRRRSRWDQAGLDPTRLVFIDETWIKTNMAPLRGWGARGKRLKGYAPNGRWRTMTFLAALRCDSLTAPCVIDGPINGQLFLAYVWGGACPHVRLRNFTVLGKDATKATARGYLYGAVLARTCACNSAIRSSDGA